jgi:large subunit ribosomal protein L28
LTCWPFESINPIVILKIRTFGGMVATRVKMSKRCQITGKGVMSGNNVSHAKNRTRRKFLPNLQRTSMSSEILGRNVSLRVSTSAIRTIEKHGGLDGFLLQARNAELADDARSLKREILAVQSA